MQRLCDVLGLKRDSDYKWRKRGKSKRALEDEMLIEQIVMRADFWTLDG